MKPSSRILLIILDGFGIGKNPAIDAIAQAKKPFIDSLMKSFPWTVINASSEDVGLPSGQMGNSEVGHMNIGAGRVVYQEITRIDRSIRGGDFFRIPAFLEAARIVRAVNSSLHFIGLLSDGGVHSMNTHLYALLELARRENLPNVFVHALTDGRDTPPDGGVRYIAELLGRMKKTGTGTLATVMGRYYGMDRDNRWERTEMAYRAIAEGKGERSTDPLGAVRASYAKGATDEFIVPIVFEDASGNPQGIVRDGDAVVFFNFRTDRTRQLTRAFIDNPFHRFYRELRDIYFATMTRYHEDFRCPAAFPPSILTRTLGEILSGLGLRQLHVAETEKYAHVTFFFNGGREEPFPGEDRILVPSPRGVPTYDMKPEMSAPEITDKTVGAIGSGVYDFIVMNYANADMVGHSGKMDATVHAVEVLDGCLARVVPAAREAGFTTIITADHGNADMMEDGSGGPHTAHTTNRVPFIVVSDRKRYAMRREGKLADIAPTILKIMEIPAPPEMDGVPLADERQ
ncbi:MAG TPA: 2,3-bisphosphoglycerate-independent phosphoglycerate mutase [Bacteroidota bacterium]|nr:2,3-bisphosphoglycerate-independent phosphoglycerate mutase [Bacteroidota bacterium]